MKRERGLRELLAEDPGELKAALSDTARRHFLISSLGLGAYALLGRGVIPVALAENTGATPVFSKERLTILNDRPLNAETPVHLLNDPLTPNDLHFVRNNGIVPDRAIRHDASEWSLTIDGEVSKPISLSLDQLKRNFRHHTLDLVIECGGNGRAGFRPKAKGNQWTLGAVGCSRYTGVRLKDVLASAGLKDTAAFIAYYGEDKHLSGDKSKQPISRGIPLNKALDEHTLLAFEMNGEPLPPMHGFPVRLIASGYPGSVSGKWLTRLWVRDRIHDGPKMGGYSYRIPKHPVKPGASVPESEMMIIEQMPVKSIITRPKNSFKVKVGKPIEFGGHAWATSGVQDLSISADFGATWIKTELSPPRNKFAWQNWKHKTRFTEEGYYEIWAKATDSHGVSQPMVVPGWNPKGYLNNALHRIAVYVA